MRKKLKDTSGLTMVEMLCAVAILVLLCLMMNTGIGMAVKTYRDITAESETELLVSSLTDALADKLRYCVVTEKPPVSPATDPTYPLSIGEVTVVDGKIVVQEKNASGFVTSTKQLLPKGAYGAYDQFSAGYIGDYKVAAPSSPEELVKYNEATNSFEVKFTVTSEQLAISRTVEFTVRCLNPLKLEKEV